VSSYWCETCEQLAVETYNLECGFCDSPLVELDPFELASVTLRASYVASFVREADRLMVVAK
jgi:hypothetical protein